jgi:hypothetical protein
MTPTRSRVRSIRLVVGAGLAFGLGLAAAPAAEVVILKDGFALQGNVSKESTVIRDAPSGKLIPIPKDTGYDLIDDGAKVTVFSRHFRQLGEVNKEVKLRPDYRAYQRNIPGRKGNDPLPQGFALESTSPFDARWTRKIKVRVPPNSFEIIEEQITHIDPYFTYLVSTTHNWRSAYRTSEFSPAEVRRMLLLHPDLAEPDGKPNAAKRVAVAKFMLDAGWLNVAKDDLEAIRRTFPDGMPEAAKEPFDKLVKEVEAAGVTLIIKEAELALGAGRYTYAGEILNAIPEKLTDAKQLDDLTKLKARLQGIQERHETGRRLLRALLDEVSGMGRARPAIGVCGGLVGAVWPGKELPSPVSNLVDAGEKVYAELHPDTAQRIESFVSLAAQAERERLQGRDPTKKPDELLATVVSGWAMGKNGATPDPKQALKLWTAREAVMAYQRTEDMNSRNRVLNAFKASAAVSIDELAQIISLLPPAAPENLLFRTGTPVKGGMPPGVYRRTTRPTGEHPIGTPYFVKLPPEYHHGRAYPVIIALAAPNFDVEPLVAGLSVEADRNGYIVLAPDWTNKFASGWKWDGDDHWYVTSVLQEAVKTFCVDNDRVFLLGIGEGANMALDVGLSHPDLFAGVLPICPIPKPNLFTEYWKNGQALPFYVVTGELAGGSTAELKKQLFDRWMNWGFPALMNVYKGRGVDWYSAEFPVMFDWMGRRKRGTATSVLKLPDQSRKDWQTMRTGDNRFYWLEVDEIEPKRLIANAKAASSSPAHIQGDISGDNVIRVNTFGIKKFSVLLTPELIDWAKPVRVSVNNGAARDFKPQVIKPNMDLLLEDYRIRGDRRVLIWARLEFKVLGG